jgi:hypothetical protein
MNIEYKFVNGQGDSHHEKAINAAATEGYAVKLMAFDPSETANVNNQQIVILMEKRNP